MSHLNNSFKCLSTLDVNGKKYNYYAIYGGKLANNSNINRLPVSTKIPVRELIAS
jgi:hypothetical protein